MQPLTILYISVHEVLEYDDLLMLTSLGHKVFSVGRFSDPASQAGSLRAPRASFYQPELFASYKRFGVAREFISQFDIILCNHDISYIHAHLPAFEGKAIVYRTIGQSSLGIEQATRDVQDRITIVRYSEKERNLPGFANTDAVIYFCKDVGDYPDWVGGGPPLTFHNNFRDRDYCSVPSTALHEQLTRGFEADLFGLANQEVGGWRGVLPPHEMSGKYATCSCYVYVWTFQPSYTLSLMEAMLTGAPVLAPSRTMIDAVIPHLPDSMDKTRISEWNPDRYEVEDLLDGPGCLVYDTLEDGRELLRTAMRLEPAVLEAASRTRDRAREIFDMRLIGQQWNALFAKALGKIS